MVDTTVSASVTRPESLIQCLSTDSKLFGQSHLIEQGSFGELPAEDVFPEGFDDALDHGWRARQRGRGAEMVYCNRFIDRQDLTTVYLYTVLRQA